MQSLKINERLIFYVRLCNNMKKTEKEKKCKILRHKNRREIR